MHRERSKLQIPNLGARLAPPGFILTERYQLR
jgi:hypothetical protein